MRPRSSSLIASFALVLAVAAGAFADLRAATEAMACCAKTDYSCTGLRSPDDCCRQMGHGAHGVTVSPVPDRAPSSVDAVAVVPPYFVESAPASGQPLDTGAFKRPHDPPHLHTYSLLI